MKKQEEYVGPRAAHTFSKSVEAAAKKAGMGNDVPRPGLGEGVINNKATGLFEKSEQGSKMKAELVDRGTKSLDGIMGLMGEGKSSGICTIPDAENGGKLATVMLGAEDSPDGDGSRFMSIEILSDSAEDGTDAIGKSVYKREVDGGYSVDPDGQGQQLTPLDAMPLGHLMSQDIMLQVVAEVAEEQEVSPII